MDLQSGFSLFPLVSEKEVFPAVPSTKGSIGYGEGFEFGTNSFRRTRTFFYRFVGKSIPRDQLCYLSCEDNFFSRTKGDKTQLIVAWDEENKGFRVLMEYNSSTGFMDVYRPLAEMELMDAVVFLGQKKQKENELSQLMSNVNIDDLF